MQSSSSLTSGDRLKSLIAVGLIHAALAFALLHASGNLPAIVEPESIQLFDVREVPPPPPPPPEQLVPDAAPREEGAAAPPNLESKASPVVAPKPKIILPTPPPVVAAPTPATGNQRSQGAAPLSGPGTGAGGVGSGTGSGGSGAGTGGGGAGGSRARYLSGRIKRSDYPRELRGRRIPSESVIVQFTIGLNGRPRGCRVFQSSGNQALDATTCRLIEQRFRYQPARNAAGQSIEAQAAWKQVWWIEGNIPPSDLGRPPPVAAQPPNAPPPPASERPATVLF